jgi:hypothetical protein
MYEDLEQLANLKFAKVVDEISGHVQAELSKARANARGVGISGFFEQRLLAIRLQGAEQICRALCDIWVELITQRKESISRDDVRFVMGKVEGYAQARTGQLCNSHSSAMAQLPSGAVDALRERAQRGMALAVSGIRRDLEIKFREQEAFPNKRADMTQRSIQLNIQNSNIANLNLGSQLGTIQTTLQSIANEHHEEVAEALKRLTEGIADSTALNDPAKTEAIEAVSVLAKQAEANPEERSSVTVKALLNWMPSLIGMAADLTTLWEKVGPTIKTHFGI